MTTKVLKLLSIMLFCIILIVGMTIMVFADLFEWYSNSDTIGTWVGTQIKYGHKKLNSSSYFNFYASGLYAMKQWEDVLDISIENVLLMSEASITVFGGTWDEITALGLPFHPSALGYSYYSKASVLRTEYINGKEVTVKQIERAVIVIIDKGLMSEYNHVTTHELGHALGWVGHSSESSDLMYAVNNSTTVLTSRDTAHLCQVY